MSRVKYPRELRNERWHLTFDIYAVSALIFSQESGASSNTLHSASMVVKYIWQALWWPACLPFMHMCFVAPNSREST